VGVLRKRSPETGLSAVGEEREAKMETAIKLHKKSEELKMEWYDAEISLSEADRSLKDLPALIKKLLEKDGQQVRAVEVSTAFEKFAQAAAAKAQAGSGVKVACGCYHIAYPPAERSCWIVVNLRK
jgi:hypothetical protein